MKSLFLFFLLIPSIFLNGQAHDTDEMEIRNLLTRQNAAWNRGDVDAFMVGYWESDSLMFIGSSGVTYGYKNTLANYKKRYPDTAAMGQLTFNLIDFKKLSGEYYHVTGKWSLQRSIGNASGHFTLLFRKIKGKWVIISDHSS
jgi:ketosteroid isomerase-like protein